MVAEAPLKTDNNMMQILAIVLLLASGALFLWGISFDPSVASDATESLAVPERIINNGLLATKNSIIIVACSFFVSGWVVLAASHIGTILEVGHSRVDKDILSKDEESTIDNVQEGSTYMG